jgi:hypothetical protein
MVEDLGEQNEQPLDQVEFLNKCNCWYSDFDHCFSLSVE